MVEALFAVVGRQLEATGLAARSCALMDSTLVAAAVKPPKSNASEVSERDPEASWTKKNGKSHLRYKAHIAVDAGSEIIRKAILTSADLHDSQLGGVADPRRRNCHLFANSPDRLGFLS